MRNTRWYAAAAAICAAILVAAGINFSVASQQAATETTIGRSGSCQVDAQGYCTVQHGLGVKPSSVLVQPAYIGQLASVDPATITATSYTVRFWWYEPGLFPAGTTIKFDSIITVPEATTPPTSATPTGSPTTASPPPSSTPPTSVTPTVPQAACTKPVYTTSARENNGTGGFSNGGFVVHNNEWNNDHGPQTLNACSYRSWYVISNQPGAGNDDSVKTYPGTQKLVDIPMSALGNISSTFSVATPPGSGTIPTATGKGKQWNAAYDLWLDNFGTEVMIWNDWTMNWRYWYGQYSGHQATIDGVVYNAYHSGSAMWFVRAAPVKSGTVDIDNVLKYAQGQGWLKATQRVNAIEYGFEIAYTGADTRFDLLDYSLTTG